MIANALYYINYRSGEPRKVLYGRARTPFGFIGSPNEMSGGDLQGRIFVLELPAGKHQIDQWAIEQGKLSFLYPKQPPPPLEFKVAAGEIHYLGNFHMQMEAGKNWVGMTIPVAGYPTIKDMNERDVDMFRERYPQFANRPVRVDVLATDVWVSGSFEEEELVVPKSK